MDLRTWVKRSEIAGKGRVLPVGFSALYPLCFQSNLYTRTSMCNWKTDCSAKWWRQKKKCKEFWEQREREEHSQGCAVMDICRETFPVCPVFCRSSCAATVLHHTTSSSNWQKETWDCHLKGTVQSEKCPYYCAIFPEPRSEREMCPMQCVLIMWQIWVLLLTTWIGNVLFLFITSAKEVINKKRRLCFRLLARISWHSIKFWSRSESRGWYTNYFSLLFWLTILCVSLKF